MKKIKLILVITLLSFSTNLSAQLFEEGNVVITPYYGAPNFGKIFGRLVEKEVDVFKIDKGAGPYGIRGEFFITEKFSAGFDFIYNEVSGNGTFDSTRIDGLNNVIDTTYTINARSRRFRFLLKANYHIYTTDNFDFYAGAGIGANFRKIEIETNIPKFNDKNIRGAILPISGRVALGTTYYPLDFLGLNLEFGIGGPLVSGGLSIKI